ncbi:MAG: M10 family metallopeptidase C-terminal domain-containing protein [Dongiaceae bacterium]
MALKWVSKFLNGGEEGGEMPFVRFQFGRPGHDQITGGDGRDFIFGSFGNDLIDGRGGRDTLLGGFGRDTIHGGSGDDYVNGGAGNDDLKGGLGRDIIVAAAGNDMISGGGGDDRLFGGSGADRFMFDPSNSGEGADSIADFKLGQDKIVLNAADILRADPNLVAASGDPTLLDATDFDADSSWDVVASKDGDVTVVHPNGTIEIDGIKFGDGTDSFAELLPALELTGLVVGTDAGETLTGDKQDNVIAGKGGNDNIAGGSGDDILIGGAGADRFLFNPNNPNEGADAINDFNPAEDKIVLSVADILAADPDIVAASGDPTKLEPSDFDADPDWDVVASADGDVQIVHPNGTIELNGIPFGPATDSFADLLPALELTA